MAGPSSTVVPLTQPPLHSTLQLDDPNRAAPETSRRVPTRGKQGGHCPEVFIV
jgi:hypothetical protein